MDPDLNPILPQPQIPQPGPLAPPPDLDDPIGSGTRKKALILVVAFLVLFVGGGIAAFFILGSKPASKPGANGNNAQQEPTDVPENKYTGKVSFFVAQNPKEVNLYNPSTKAKRLETNIAHDAFYFNNIYSNSGLQYSPDGLTQYYATAKVRPDHGEVGTADSTTLYEYKEGIETKLVTFDLPAGLDDWVLSNDGKFIYYIQSMQKSPGQNSQMTYDLFIFNTATRTSTMIKANIEQKASRLQAVQETVRFYTFAEGKTVEHSLVNGSYTSTVLADLPCDNVFYSFPEAVSPDASTLLLNCQSAGKFALFGVSITDKTATKLYSLDLSTETLRAAIWSPDSKHIAFDVSPYGVESEVGNFNNRFDLLEVTTGKVTTAVSNPSPAANRQFVEVLSWSPDGRYIAFAQNDKVKLYDIINSTATDTELNIEIPVSSSTAFGWTLH